MAKRFITPFAEAGDRAEISNEPIGSDVNMQTGYPAEYEADPVSDPNARFVERDKTNQLYNDITANIKEWQENTYPAFITAANNGGTAFSYKKGDRVSYNGDNYESLEGNNEDIPTTSKWVISRPTDVIKSMLIAQGLSGNYGFFSDGFTYVNSGDIGIHTDNTIWVIGTGSATVAAGTVPSATDYYQVYLTNNRELSATDLVGTYPHSNVIKTTSYYSKAECESFGIDYPDGGGARYLAIDATGVTVDGIKYIQLAGGKVAELLDRPNFFNAGIVANYIDSASKGFDNKDKLTALDLIAQDYGRLELPKGKFYTSEPITFSVDVVGAKGAEMYVEPPLTLAPLIALSEGVIARRVTVRPAITNATKHFIANDYTNTFGSGFDYHKTAGGITGLGGNVIIDCQALGMERGARGDGHDITYVRGKYEGGEWGASIYAKKKITFSGTLIIGGNAGGMAMPSCQGVTVCNGATVYNPNGTGVNTGGSSAAGYNAKDINVVGVNVYARDCINLENGCVGANISGYHIKVITESESNGVGIGVFSRTSDGGGHVSDICIGSGKIGRGNNKSFAFAVRVGVQGASPDVTGISISGVHSEGSRQGIVLDSPTGGVMRRLCIGANNMLVGEGGYALPQNLADSSISGGLLTVNSATTASSKRGLRMFNMTKVAINGVTTVGFYPHYEQNNVVVTSKIIEPIIIKGADNANTVDFSNLSGGAAIPVTYAS